MKITRFSGNTGSVEVVLNRPSGKLSSLSVTNINNSINRLLNFPMDSNQKKSISDEILATKALQLIGNGNIQGVAPLPSSISFEIILSYSITYES